MKRSVKAVSATFLAAAFCLVGLCPQALGQTKDAAKEKGGNIRKLLAQARNGSIRERREAIQTLGGIRDREAVRQWDIIGCLVDLSRDDHPLLARLAVKALGNLAQWERSVKDQVRDPLVKILKNTEGHMIVRREAINVLGDICSTEDFSDKLAVDALVRAMRPSKDYPPELSAAAILVVGKLGVARASSTMRELLSHKDPDVRAAAVEALKNALSSANVDGFLKDAALINRLKNLLDDAAVPPDVKARIIEVLARLVSEGKRVPWLEQYLVKALGEADAPETVVSTLRAISRTGYAKAATLLPKVHARFSEGENRSDKVCIEVCETTGALFDLWGRGRTRNVPASLVGTLVDMLAGIVMKGQGSSATEAAHALGNLYSRKHNRTKAVAVLIAALATEGVGADIKKAAVDSLEVITGRAFGDDAERWTKWFRANSSSLGSRGM